MSLRSFIKETLRLSRTPWATLRTELFSYSLIIASKYLHDISCTNKYWSKIIGLAV
jgi:hypothetical protein